MNKELTNEDRRQEFIDTIYSMLASCKQIGDSRVEVLQKVAAAINGIDLLEEVKIACLKDVKRIMDEIHY